MQTLYLALAMSGLFQHSKTQYINIWEDMDKNHGWTGYNSYNFSWISEHCRTSTSPCAYVTANNNEPSYIQKITNITTYSSIQLQIDINADILQQTVCQIWFNFDNNEYTKYSDWKLGKYTNVIINLPQSDTTIANILYIKLQIVGNHGTCYWDNAILRGIPSSIDTTKPIASLPTITFTEMLPPTFFPTITFNGNGDINKVYATNKRPTIFDTFIIPVIVATCSGIFVIGCVIIVILRMVCQKNDSEKFRKNIQKSCSITNEVIQNEVKLATSIEMMSPLQLSEPVSQVTAVNSGMDSKQWIVPLKKGNYFGMNAFQFENQHKQNVPVSNVQNVSNVHRCNDSEETEIPFDRPHINNYPTQTLTSTSLNLASVNSYTYGDQLNQLTNIKSAVYDANTSSQFSKLEQILNKFMDDNKYEFSSTETSMCSTIETNTDIETATDINLDTASTNEFLGAQWNCIQDQSGRYVETFV